MSFSNFYYSTIVSNLDRGLVGIYTLLLGALFCVVMEKMTPQYDEKYKQKSLRYKLFDASIITIVIMVFSRYLTPIASSIPFLYDYSKAYTPYKHLSTTSNTLISFSIIGLFPSYRSKMMDLVSYINKKQKR